MFLIRKALAVGVIASQYSAATPILKCQTAMLECDASNGCGYFQCVAAIPGCAFLVEAQLAACNEGSDDSLLSEDHMELPNDPLDFTPTSDECLAALTECSSILNGTMFGGFLEGGTDDTMSVGASLQPILNAFFGDGDLNDTLAELETQCHLFTNVSLCIVSDEVDSACKQDEGFQDFRSAQVNNTDLTDNCTSEIENLREEIESELGDVLDIPGLEFDFEDLFDSNSTDGGVPDIDLGGLLDDILGGNISTVDIPDFGGDLDIESLIDTPPDTDSDSLNDLLGSIING